MRTCSESSVMYRSSELWRKSIGTENHGLLFTHYNKLLFMDYHKMALAYMASSQYKTDTDPTSVKSHCFVPDTKYDTSKSDEIKHNI